MFKYSIHGYCSDGWWNHYIRSISFIFSNCIAFNAWEYKALSNLNKDIKLDHLHINGYTEDSNCSFKLNHLLLR